MSDADHQISLGRVAKRSARLSARPSLGLNISQSTSPRSNIKQYSGVKSPGIAVGALAGMYTIVHDNHHDSFLFC